MVHDRHQLHELGVDPAQLVVQPAGAHRELVLRLDDLRFESEMRALERRGPVPASVCACALVGAVTINESVLPLE